MLGSAVGGYLDPQVLQGPQLGDIPVQTSQEGVPRPIVYGSPQPFPGNIIQTGPKVFSTKETKQGKGGGPVIESEEVHQTYAIRICEGPAVCIQIFRDGKLVWDRSGTAVFDADSAAFSSKALVYEGDESQLPCSVLEALPAEKGGGVGNVPAYRGTAYMVIELDNLTGTGGRIPNYEFRMSSNAVVSDSCEDSDALFWYPLDDAARDGVAREIISGKDGVYSDTDGVASGPALRAGSSGSFRMQAKEDGMLAYYPGDTVLTMVGRPEWTTRCYFRLDDEDVGDGGSVLRNIASFWQSEQFGYLDWGFSLDSTDNLIPTAAYSDGATDGHFLLATGALSGGHMMQTMAADRTWTLYINGEYVTSQVMAIGDMPGRPGGFMVVGASQYPDSYGFIGCVSDVAGWSRCFTPEEAAADYMSLGDYTEIPDAPGSYVTVNGSITTLCAPRATTSTIYLSDIELDIASRCGLSASQFDVSEVTAIEVEGYLVGKQTSGSGALAPLAAAHFHDMPEDDLQIHARRRGGASVVTLTDDDFVDSGEDEEVRAQAIELPRKLNLYFSDPAANYAVVPVSAERVSTNVKASGIAAVQLPMVMHRDSGKQKAEVMLKCIYEESQGRLVRELPAYKYAFLTPSDCFTYDNKRWRIDKLEQLEGTIKIEAVRDRISNYTSQATAGSVVNPSDPIANVKGPSFLVAMNLPSLRTSDTQSGVYIAVTGVLAAWNGADVYLSVDGGESEQLALVATQRAIMGDLTVDIDSNDEPIVVALYDNRDVETVTPDQLAARQNAFAIITAGVAEVGQFMTATEDVDLNWELTDTARGQLDTAAASHSAGDRFVLLDGAVYFVPIDSVHAGQTLIFRAVSRGTAPANNETVSVVFDPPTFIRHGGVVTP